MLAAPRAAVTVCSTGDLAAIDAPPRGAIHDGDRPPDLPFAGGWIAYFGYELGRVLEPAVALPGCGAVDDRGWPLAVLLACPDAYVFDQQADRWWSVGAPPAPDPAVRVDAVRVGARSRLDTAAHATRARRVLEYIAAGDIFQANLTGRLSADVSGSTRRLLLAALGRARYGAYLELPEGRCVLSLSPELFLDADLRHGTVVTRPIKGTRPSAAAVQDLLESPKDAAELNMIIDLMRNDLGRVCAPGTVQVPRGRTIEAHPTILHGVGEVTGRLRPGVGPTAMLRAAFPAGSVTGAPKIRAMQIIDELEPVARGVYAGAVLYADFAGNLDSCIAIRTIVMRNGRAHVQAGAGIVADSVPERELEETDQKAAAAMQALSWADEAEEALPVSSATADVVTS